ncbi:MAG: guanylyltransferase [Neisseriaceae bacterium]|nr:guanylyltransferase [Neisseriaceae bacterium]
MKFDDFDAQMRIYEQSIDQFILPDLYLVARLKGRSFTKLTKEICQFERPFDLKFHHLMTNTTSALMEVGFNIIYGYTENDEIFLLFHPEDRTFNLKVQKINSILAGEASAYFSLELGKKVAFDCRVVPLPNINRVADYFLWRQANTDSNALNAYCDWVLCDTGQQSQQFLVGTDISFKVRFLLNHGIDFRELPHWQRFGSGVYFQQTNHQGFNPLTEQETTTQRRKLVIDEQLPVGDYYRQFIQRFFQAA